MFVSCSNRTLIGHLEVIIGPWVNPRHGRGPWDQVTALAKGRTKLYYTLNCHGTLLFSQILNMFICAISEQNVFAADKEIHNLRFLIINNKYRNQVTFTQTKQPLKDGALFWVG